MHYTLQHSLSNYLSLTAALLGLSTSPALAQLSGPPTIVPPVLKQPAVDLSTWVSTFRTNTTSDVSIETHLHRKATRVLVHFADVHQTRLGINNDSFQSIIEAHNKTILAMRNGNRSTHQFSHIIFENESPASINGIVHLSEEYKKNRNTQTLLNLYSRTGALGLDAALTPSCTLLPARTVALSQRAAELHGRVEASTLNGTFDTVMVDLANFNKDMECNVMAQLRNSPEGSTVAFLCGGAHDITQRIAEYNRLYPEAAASLIVVKSKEVSKFLTQTRALGFTVSFVPCN